MESRCLDAIAWRVDFFLSGSEVGTSSAGAAESAEASVEAGGASAIAKDAGQQQLRVRA